MQPHFITRDSLQLEGYTVWIDKEQMSGDIIDAMEGAISSSDVIVIVFSKGYAKSDNCKKEFKYAIKRGAVHSFMYIL